MCAQRLIIGHDDETISNRVKEGSLLPYSQTLENISVCLTLKTFLMRVTVREIIFGSPGQRRNFVTICKLKRKTLAKWKCQLRAILYLHITLCKAFTRNGAFACSVTNNSRFDFEHYVATNCDSAPFQPRGNDEKLKIDNERLSR